MQDEQVDWEKISFVKARVLAGLEDQQTEQRIADGLNVALSTTRHHVEELKATTGCGDVLASLVGLGLPWMELLTGGLLFFALLPPVGALSGGMLAIGFAFSGAAVLFRGMDVPCGCASAGEKERVTPATLVRALTILGSCVFLLVSGAATTQIPTLAAGALAVVALLPGGLSAKRRITRAHLKRLAERRDREERSRLAGC